MKKESVEALVNSGWTKDLIEGPWGHFYIDLPDRRLVSFSKITKTYGKIRWIDTASLSTQEFREASAAVSSRSLSKTAWFAQRKNSWSDSTQYEGDLFQERTAFLIDWCNGLDIQQELEAQTIPNSSNYGPRSLVLITCLACLGRVSELENFLRLLNKGESPLAPMIKQSHLENAVKHAETV